ncbi:hypothetical protein PSYMO_38208, partial [Pseudomonas amygdali pv. mori str. 301020]
SDRDTEALGGNILIIHQRMINIRNRVLPQQLFGR